MGPNVLSLLNQGSQTNFKIKPREWETRYRWHNRKVLMAVVSAHQENTVKALADKMLSQGLLIILHYQPGMV